MASELIVQTIQGPSSGANANKVLIPSGHTLDVSGGTLVPNAGAVVQHVTSDITATASISTSTTSWFDLTTVNITPRFNNSVMLIMFDWFIYSPVNSTAYLLLSEGANNNSIGGYYTQWVESSRIDQHIHGHQHYQFNSTSPQTVKLRARTDGSTHAFGGGRQGTLTVMEIKQ